MEEKDRSWLSDYARVARFEYLPAEGPALLAPVILALLSSGGVNFLLFTEAVAVFALLYFAGFVINALTDYDVDVKYKTYVAEAGKRIGPTGLKALVALQTGLAFFLILHISLAMDALWLIPFTAAGVFFGLGYSIPPFHFKVRGVWHAIALSTSAFFVPVTFLYYVAAGSLNVWVLVAIGGLTLVHYGMALTNQCGDYLEDRAAGMLTPGVRWGLRRTLFLALALMFVGIPIVIVSVSMLVSFSVGVGTGGVGTGAVMVLGYALPLRFIVPLLISIPMFAGYGVAIRGIQDLRIFVPEKDPDRRVMYLFKKRMRYPIWQASGVWGTVASLGVAFLLVSILMPPSEHLPHTFSETFSVSANGVFYFTEDNATIASLTFVVTSGNPVEKNSLALRVQSWYAGVLLDENTAILDRYLVGGDEWRINISVRCHTERDTDFHYYLIRTSVTEERTLVENTIWSEKPIYLTDVKSAEYVAESLSGVDKRANVTVTFYVDRNIYPAGSIKVVVNSITKWGGIYDSETLEMNRSLQPGDKVTLIFDLDIPEVSLEDVLYNVYVEEVNTGHILDQQTVQ